MQPIYNLATIHNPLNSNLSLIGDNIIFLVINKRIFFFSSNAFKEIVTLLI